MAAVDTSRSEWRAFAKSRRRRARFHSEDDEHTDASSACSSASDATSSFDASTSSFPHSGVSASPSFSPVR